MGRLPRREAGEDTGIGDGLVDLVCWGNECFLVRGVAMLEALYGNVS